MKKNKTKIKKIIYHLNYDDINSYELGQYLSMKNDWKTFFSRVVWAKKNLAERGFDPRTSGLWAQHASAAPLCSDKLGVYLCT